MITGSPLLDALAFAAIGWCGAILLLPIAQWIDYKRDCKKYNTEEEDDTEEDNDKP